MLDKRNYIQQQFQCFNFQMDCSSNVKIILKKKALPHLSSQDQFLEKPSLKWQLGMEWLQSQPHVLCCTESLIQIRVKKFANCETPN